MTWRRLNEGVGGGMHLVLSRYTEKYFI